MGLPPLTAEQSDALREISRRGMEHAATALSQLMGKTVFLAVPRVHAMNIAHIPTFFGGPQRMVFWIHLRILGDLRGSILIVFPRESAVTMLEKLLGSVKEQEGTLTELELSALREVGNILSSAYLSALGDMFGVTLIPSVPVLSLDMVETVVDHLCSESAEGDVSLMMETEFAGEDGVTNGHVFLLPNISSLDIILRAVGMEHERKRC